MFKRPIECSLSVVSHALEYSSLTRSGRNDYRRVGTKCTLRNCRPNTIVITIYLVTCSKSYCAIASLLVNSYYSRSLFVVKCDFVVIAASAIVTSHCPSKCNTTCRNILNSRSRRSAFTCSNVSLC